MTWENIKSILLSILVGTSLLLTLAIWNYQPEYDVLETGNIIDESTKISYGSKEALNTIIHPKQIVFHQNNRIFSPDERSKENELFKEIRTWPINDFQYRSKGTYNRNSTIEVVFPTPIPIKTLLNSLTVKQKEKENVPNLSIDRMLIQMSQRQSSSLVYFVSSKGEENIKAEIENFDVYSNVEDYLVNPYAQENYVTFDKDRKSPIYLPADRITLPMKTYPTTLMNVKPFINVLFNNPNLVGRNSSNVGGDYYSDGTRRLLVYQNETMMEFINPAETEYSTMNRSELIRQSLEFVNDHNGWTDHYNLYHIDQNKNNIRYRLMKDNYPVFDEENRSVILQQWKNKEIFKYQRSRLRLLSPFGSQEVTLRSGSDVLAYLENAWKQYPPYLIDDIAIGYHMKRSGSSSNIFTLEPAWFIKVGEWQRIKFDEGMMNQGGGK